MGNHHSSKSLKSLKSKKKISSHEAFFIAHHRVQQQSEQQQQSYYSMSIDYKKRVIFVSLMGLYQSWRSCPSPILYSSIFILPLKKQWIYQPAKCSYQHDFGRLFHDVDFVKLLKWKNEQGLVFWMKDCISLNELNQCITPSTPDFIENTDIIFPDDDDSMSAIAPFWRYLSYKLSLLYDPVTGKKYNPLLLDPEKYKERELKYNTTNDQIKKELYFLTMRFKSMSEIIYQSNQTLIIITTWSLNENSNNCETPEMSQKSYNSLPDHKLNEMTANIDINDDAVKEIQFIGDITPNPNLSNTKSPSYDTCCNKDKNKENIWWVSEEYGEDVSNHDNDTLYNNDDDDNEINTEINTEIVDRKTN